MSPRVFVTAVLHRVGTLDYMSPEVVSLPTADERKKMEIAGRQVTEQPYGEKVSCGKLALRQLSLQAAAVKCINVLLSALLTACGTWGCVYMLCLQ